MQEQERPGDERPLARNARVDAIVAASMILVGVIVLVEARHLGAGWTSDGPGAGYFPFYVGLILVIGGLGIVWQSLWSKSSDMAGTFVTRGQLRRVMQVMLPTAAFIALLALLGMYIASVLFIAAFMVWMGGYGVVRSAAIGVGVAVFFFVLFEVWFKVPLFKGMVNLLAFLGY